MVKLKEFKVNCFGLTNVGDGNMSKLNNPLVKVNVTTNPYRTGTFKFLLMKWALEQTEPFTKEQFLKACLELKAEFEVTSRMSDEVMAKAWWNEFFNKHEVFEPLK